MFNAFLTKLKNAAPKCPDENQVESIIRDQIIFDLAEKSMKEYLLRDGDINLTKTAQYCRSDEASKFQVKELHGEALVNAVMRSNNSKTNFVNECEFCGYSHKIPLALTNKLKATVDRLQENKNNF